MGAEISVDTAYGVAIDLEATSLSWNDLPEAGDVISIGVGCYGDHKRRFLVISKTLKGLEPGGVAMVQPYQAASDPYLTWDAMLVAAAEDLKVPIVGQPGWLFALDES
ncbi:hypothetical protein ACFW2V_14030 [Streptomyces sp. NPDC058947]|uniref:hypothetical protein n=1 Tax=Streptomyces sp. NPDC058947 TaxID=3346675 RepID=UPI0036B51CF4